MKTWVSMFVALGLVASSGAADRALVTTTDFSTGSLASVDLESFEAAPNLLTIHSDAVVRIHNGAVYVINRFGQDNITVLNPEDPQEVLAQYSVGNGTNPYDLALAGAGRAYVARLGSPRLLIVNPETGDSLGSVDLSFAADSDGVPEAARLELVGTRLYVTCQRLTSFAPSDYSEIIVVDTATDAPLDMDEETDGTQGIRMASKNPVAQQRVGNRLILSSAGTYGEADGGIEVVDLDDNVSLGVQLTEEELGGDVGTLAMRSASIGYVVVADAMFNNAVKAFDLDTDGLPVPVDGTAGYIPDMSVLRNRLYVADQGSFSVPGSAGLRIFDTSTHELVEGPIDTGLPPASIGFLVDASVLSSDFTGDGRVDFQDFLAFAGAFGTVEGDSRYESRFDLDGSGRIDFQDFLVFAGDFGKSTS